MHRPKYEHLQTTAFHIADPALLNRSYHLLRFPAKWKTPLLKLAARPDQDTPRIPIKSLNRTLIALIPDIVQVATYATRGQDPIWIVSDRRIPPQAVFAIVAAWVRTQGWRNPSILEQTLAAMDASDLHWEESPVDYAEQLRLIDATDQRVREQAKTVVFKLLPHELAARLSRPGLVCDHSGNETSAFRRCSTPSGEGAEIMSWPPHGQAERPFSFTVHLSAETLPFGSEARIYAHFGVRRWVHRTPSLDANTYSAVYLNPSVPWIKRGVSYSPSFQRASLRLRVEGDGQATVRRAVWSDAFTRVLQEVNAADHIAFPESIRTEPRALLDREQGGAALAYREGMYSFPGRPPGKHPASPGLALIDRPRLLDWVATHTAPALRLTEPLPRSPISVLPDLHHTASRSDQDEHAGEALRTAIRATIKQPRLRIEIYYDTQRTLDYALATLQEQLAVKFELGDTAATGPVHVHTAIRTPQLDITLRIQPVGALGADLEPNARIRRAVERLQQAVEQRAAHIQEQLPPIEPDEVAVALVEIAGKDTYKGRRRQKDPKFAIRHGFNLAGRLTQFLQPVAAEEEPGDDDLKSLDGRDQARPRSDPEAERLHSSWQDLWRQLGARPRPISAPQAGLPPTHFLTFYVVRQNQTRTWGATRQVPIAVLINPAGEDIQVKAPGLRDWLPLHQALLAVGRAHVMGGQTRTPQQITDFFHEVLTQELDTSQPLLLLTLAQNNRPGWTFLNNGQLIADSLQFGKRAPQAISEFPELRHVRVRTDQRNETPEGYAVQSAQKGHAGALWQVADRIWFSTADKPASARNALRYSSMVEPIEKPDGTMQPPRPGARVWNHQLVELAVAGLQASDDPGGEALAALVHDLRWAAPHHAQPTVLPWPLHLTQLIGEYIVPIKLVEEIEASGSEEAPETEVRDQLDDE